MCDQELFLPFLIDFFNSYDDQKTGRTFKGEHFVNGNSKIHIDFVHSSLLESHVN